MLPGYSRPVSAEGRQHQMQEPAARVAIRNVHVAPDEERPQGEGGQCRDAAEPVDSVHLRSINVRDLRPQLAVIAKCPHEDVGVEKNHVAASQRSVPTGGIGYFPSIRRTSEGAARVVLNLFAG